MNNYQKETINYYDKNIEEYNRTWNIDFNKEFKFEIPDIFLSYLKKDAYILDLGCGVGRDSKYFISKGYKVKSIDGSTKMCEIASANLNKPVEQINFLDIDYTDTFDGVFACASILHLNNKDLVKVLSKIEEVLKENGVLYASFKYGENERIIYNRYYNDMTEQKFTSVCKKINSFKIIKVWKTKQYKTNTEFINFIIKKIK